jgi:peptidoglycan/xylan/chitin deacetylase (PgdA/CDA1 family)
MIGVVFDPAFVASVEEFFQLFKTPWEPYEEGRRYDVVLTTEDRVPESGQKLTVVYGAATRCRDEGVRVDGIGRGVAPWILSYAGMTLPVYGHVFPLKMPDHGMPVLVLGAEVCGYRTVADGQHVVRFGYDLFAEVALLLEVGQPPEMSQVPALDIHVRVLRDVILASGIPLVEIPPVPYGFRFIACMTHDIDFVGIRQHRWDHTIWGFLYRSTLKGTYCWLTGSIPLARLLRMWMGVILLPFVHLGIVKDFWDPFPWYLRVEKDLSTTYFLVPYKNRAGENVASRRAARRATRYDVSDIPEAIQALEAAGCEIGVHGIDSWNSVERAVDELNRVSHFAHSPVTGIRMHWLLMGERSFDILDDAGYLYDSTVGYNETVGYRAGATQVFRPLGARHLLELPLHIQDGALFFPEHLGLTEPQAWSICLSLIANASEHGGVLTTLWHDRSHAPERLWGEFYVRLLDQLRASGAWFATASAAVRWFAQRREVRFAERRSADGDVILEVEYDGQDIQPPLIVRTHGVAAGSSALPSPCVDQLAWNGCTKLRLDDTIAGVARAQVIHKRDCFAAQPSLCAAKGG